MANDVATPIGVALGGENGILGAWTGHVSAPGVHRNSAEFGLRRPADLRDLPDAQHHLLREAMKLECASSGTSNPSTACAERYRRRGRPRRTRQVVQAGLRYALRTPEHAREGFLVFVNYDEDTRAAICLVRVSGSLKRCYPVAVTTSVVAGAEPGAGRGRSRLVCDESTSRPHAPRPAPQDHRLPQGTEPTVVKGALIRSHMGP